jgi:DNA-binding MarR family transcriptional regulator
MIHFRDNIVFLIAKAHQRAQGFIKKQLKPHGLTPVQCLVIEALMEEEGLSVGEIGRRLLLDTATLAGVLERMVAAGWLRREADSGDGRIARMYMSEKAANITADVEKTIEFTNDKLLSTFSPEERILFKRLLREIKEED